MGFSAMLAEKYVLIVPFAYQLQFRADCYGKSKSFFILFFTSFMQLQMCNSHKVAGYSQLMQL